MMALQLYRAMCWPWLGATQGVGYGQMCVAGKHQLVHRMAWLAFKGPIPEGLDVLHTCDNPICRYPGHLWVGTAKDNAMDKIRKGRYRNGNRKLSEAEVREIRQSPLQNGVLAFDYGVCNNTISRVRNRVTYNHVL